MPDTSLEALAKLRPAFAENGSVTAGNSSPLNDGATALVLMSDAEAKRRGLQAAGAPRRRRAPPACIPTTWASARCPSSLKALEKAGLQPSDMGLVELNEAFASQSLACVRLLGLDEEKVNVNGGAIALGHPLGSSGARLVGHAGARDGAPRRRVRPGHDVHRRGPGHRVDLAEGLAMANATRRRCGRCSTASRAATTSSTQCCRRAPTPAGGGARRARPA